MNELKHKAAFHKALTNYQLSADALKTLRQTNLVLLTAPSAGGRNTIINELSKTNQYRFIISDTTRKPRINNGIKEQNGVEYWFRDEAEMLRDIQAGEFLEAEVIHEQQVSGISIRELALASAEGKIAITDVDIGGISNVVSLKPDTVAILVLPPSFEEWQQRLLGRGAMDPIEYRHRLVTGVKIFKAALIDDFLTIVINKQYQAAAQRIDTIAHTNAQDPAQQAAGKELVQRLLEQTIAHLDKL